MKRYRQDADPASLPLGGRNRGARRFKTAVMNEKLRLNP
jgi:hypothetical protein